ncbi:MAG: carboxypeptidase-like regulatory domain-containing protein [Gemmatimonadota bacterium]|nr:carboxypeptidase-like regulatory domain-containing protein [Gemmatimonadota bacterium]
MRAAIICIIGMMGAWGLAEAEPLLEGRVRLDSGTPAVGVQVLLFDLTDLRAAPLAATTDRSGHFTLPLANLAGVLRDWPEAVGKRQAAHRALSEPGLEVLTSPGLPDSASWGVEINVRAILQDASVSWSLTEYSREELLELFDL